MNLIAYFALLAFSIISAAYWVVVLFRIYRVVRDVPGVREGLASHGSGAGSGQGGHPALVSIIVPAHNEEDEIEACAAALLAQDHPALEVIIVLDRCTDATEARLRDSTLADDPRLRIITNHACPSDWAGKCNAARLGAAHARGEWLLFTDADTRFRPSLVRAAVVMAEGRGLDLLSLLSTLTTRRWFERIVQPAASMNLLRMYPLDRANRAGAKRNFANGQFLLFARRGYEMIGGHEAVKDALLEDIAFARAVRTSGGRGGIFFDSGMLRCSMYTSFAAFREGWKRIFIEACKRRPGRLIKNGLRLLLVGVGDAAARVAFVLLCALALGDGEPLLLPAIGMSVAVMGGVLKFAALAWPFRIAGAPWWGVFGYWWSTMVLARVMFAGASDLMQGRPVRWGGREYILEPTRGRRPETPPPLRRPQMEPQQR